MHSAGSPSSTFSLPPLGSDELRTDDDFALVMEPGVRTLFLGGGQPHDFEGGVTLHIDVTGDSVVC